MRPGNGPLGPSRLKVELLKVTTQNDHGSGPLHKACVA